MGNRLCAGMSAVATKKNDGVTGKQFQETSISRHGKTLMENLHYGYKAKSGRINDIYDVRFTESPLGAGASGLVYKAVHRETSTTFALKSLDKSQAKSGPSMAALMTELRIMSTLDSPNIAKLYEVFETKTYIYLIIEMCEGGELLDYLNTNGAMPEDLARVRIKEMTDVIRYLHAHDVAHLDLKLENFLFSTKEPDAALKLIDFGLSKYIEKDSSGGKLRGALGSSLYMAPEMLLGDGAFDQQADCWSLGVITFMLLCGSPPFYGGSFEGTTALIKVGTYTIPEAKEKILSLEALEFLKSLLVVDPKKRLSSKDAQLHPWFTKDEEVNSATGNDVGDLLVGSPSKATPPSIHLSPSATEPPSPWFTKWFTKDEVNSATGNDVGDLLVESPSKATPPSIHRSPSATEPPSPSSPAVRTARANTTTIKKLVSFSEMGRFQRTVCEVLAFIQLSSSEMNELRDQFSKMDIEGEGEITVAELRLALLSSSVAEVRSLASADNDLQKLFDAVDFDHSGKIHWNEFLAATINLAAQDEQQLRKAFDRLDCDNSGEISLENLKAMVGKDIEEADLAEMLREVDIKKNGVIDYEEFSAAMSIARRRHANSSVGSSSRPIGDGEPNGPPPEMPQPQLRPADN